MIRTFSVILAMCLALPAAAQSFIGCEGWQGHARNIGEPWQDYTRTFANGNVRVSLLDTIEPANGAFYLLFLSPPYDELGSRQCQVLAESDGQTGFNSIDFQQLDANYDPNVGLTFRVPITRFAPETGGYDPAILAAWLNQSTGEMSAFFEIP